MNTPLTRAHAEQLDRSDALAPFRDEFHLPQRHDGSPSVYLCGHSLGLASRRALSTGPASAWTATSTRRVRGCPITSC
jgi:kynureninase